MKFIFDKNQISFDNVDQSIQSKPRALKYIAWACATIDSNWRHYLVHFLVCNTFILIKLTYSDPYNASFGMAFIKFLRNHRVF